MNGSIFTSERGEKNRPKYFAKYKFQYHKCQLIECLLLFAATICYCKWSAVSSRKKSACDITTKWTLEAQSNKSRCIRRTIKDSYSNSNALQLNVWECVCDCVRVCKWFCDCACDCVQASEVRVSVLLGVCEQTCVQVCAIKHAVKLRQWPTSFMKRCWWFLAQDFKILEPFRLFYWCHSIESCKAEVTWSYKMSIWKRSTTSWQGTRNIWSKEDKFEKANSIQCRCFILRPQLLSWLWRW